jgi:phosphatidylglycerol:prolipoprotein diacylglycerol transferase
MIELLPSREVILSIFGFSVHWYGIMYLTAFLFVYWSLKKLQRFRSLTLSDDDRSAVLTWAVVGVIIGGRLGYVLFYGPTYFVSHPLEVFAVWQGGMSSHGGFIGVALALWYVLKKRRINPLAFLDVIAAHVAVGLAFGRLGNFINLELYGTVTDVSWAIAIPGVEGLRHPTQLYAIAKDLFIAAVCFWHLRFIAKHGSTIAVFLIFYGVLRFVVEYYRDQPYGFIDIGIAELSRGQLLTIPVVILGLLLLWKTQRS